MTKVEMIDAIVGISEKRGDCADPRTVREIVTEIVERYFSERGRKGGHAPMSPARRAALDKNIARFKAKPTNTGIPGVHRTKSGRCQAHYVADGRRVYLGMYSDAAAAAAAIQEQKDARAKR